MKITIVTINRNNAEGLRNTILSVLCQTYSDIEYIIIDGASTDGSKEVIEEFSNNISCWISEPDTGLYNAMNKGLSKATGEYVLFLNSADVLYDGRVIEELVKNGDNADLIYGNLAIKENDNLRVLQSSKKIKYSTEYQHDIPPHPSLLIRLNLINKIGGFDESYKIVADVVLISLLLSESTVTYQYVNKTVTVFDTAGVSSNKSNQKLIFNERRRFLESKFPHYLKSFEQIYKTNWTGYISKILHPLSYIRNKN